MGKDVNLYGIKIDPKTTLLADVDIDWSVAFSRDTTNPNALHAYLPGGDDEEKAFNTSIAGTIKATNEFAKEGGHVVSLVTTDMHRPSHYFFLQNQPEIMIKRLEEIQKAVAKAGEGKKADLERVGKVLEELKGEKPDFAKIKQDNPDLFGLLPCGILMPVPPQLYVTYSAAGKIQLHGVAVDGQFFKASIDDKGHIKVGDATTEAELNKATNGLKPISTWPAHSETIEQQKYPVWKDGQFVGDADGKEVREYSGKVNAAIERISKQLNREPEVVGLDGEEVKAEIILPSIAIDSSREGSVARLVMGKGVGNDSEMYSPLRSEAKGLNEEPVKAYLSALFEKFKGNKELNNMVIPLKGIAYDYCLGNTAKDIMAFITPALKVMVAAERANKPLNIDDVVKYLAAVVKDRIKEGKDMASPIKAEDIAKHFGVTLTKENTIAITAIIPKGANISIAPQYKNVDMYDSLQAYAKEAGVTMIDQNKEAVDKLRNAGNKDADKISTELIGKDISALLKEVGVQVEAGSDFEKIIPKLIPYDQLNEAGKQRFDRIYKEKLSGKESTKNEPLDALNLKLDYLKFAIQEAAELHKIAEVHGVEKVNEITGLSFKHAKDVGVDMEGWRIARQGVFADAGVNATLPEFARQGVRFDGKLGAMGGGLADLYTAFQIDAIQTSGEQSLINKLYRADNVAFDSESKAYSPENNISKRRANTVARELMEELPGEMLISRYIARKRAGEALPILDLFPKGFRQKILSDGTALSVFAEISSAIDKAGWTDPTKKPYDATKHAEFRKEYKEFYKGTIEPLLAKFVRTTPTGQLIIGGLTKGMENGVNTFDYQFPDFHLAKCKAGGDPIAFLNDKLGEKSVIIGHTLASSTIIPKSVEHEGLTLLRELITAVDESSKNPIKEQHLFYHETKGFLRPESAAERLANALAIKTVSVDGSGSYDGIFMYPHEAFTAAMAAVDDAVAKAKESGVAIDKQFIVNLFFDASQLVPKAYSDYQARAKDKENNKLESLQFDSGKFRNFLKLLAEKRNATDISTGKAIASEQDALNLILKTSGVNISIDELIKGVAQKAVELEEAKTKLAEAQLAASSEQYADSAVERKGVLNGLTNEQKEAFAKVFGIKIDELNAKGGTPVLITTDPLRDQDDLLALATAKLLHNAGIIEIKGFVVTLSGQYKDGDNAGNDVGLDRARAFKSLLKESGLGHIPVAQVNAKYDDKTTEPSSIKLIKPELVKKTNADEILDSKALIKAVAAEAKASGKKVTGIVISGTGPYAEILSEAGGDKLLSETFSKFSIQGNLKGKESEGRFNLDGNKVTAVDYNLANVAKEHATEFLAFLEKSKVPAEFSTKFTAYNAQLNTDVLKGWEKETEKSTLEQLIIDTQKPGIAGLFNGPINSAPGNAFPALNWFMNTFCHDADGKVSDAKWNELTDIVSDKSKEAFENGLQGKIDKNPTNKKGLEDELAESKAMDLKAWQEKYATKVTNEKGEVEYRVKKSGVNPDVIWNAVTYVSPYDPLTLISQFITGLESVKMMEVEGHNNFKISNPLAGKNASELIELLMKAGAKLDSKQAITEFLDGVNGLIKSVESTKGLDDITLVETSQLIEKLKELVSIFEDGKTTEEKNQSIDKYNEGRTAYVEVLRAKDVSKQYEIITYCHPEKIIKGSDGKVHIDDVDYTIRRWKDISTGETVKVEAGKQVNADLCVRPKDGGVGFSMYVINDGKVSNPIKTKEGLENLVKEKEGLAGAKNPEKPKLERTEDGALHLDGSAPSAELDGATAAPSKGKGIVSGLKSMFGY